MVIVNPLKRFGRKEPPLCGTDLCAIAINSNGTIVDQSDTAVTLLTLWHSKHPKLTEAVQTAQETRLPAECRIGEPGTANCWIVVTPQAGRVLVVARDTTLTDNITTALMDSRSLLKDLLDAAVDFSFEVDAGQKFRFVFPKEVYGVETDRFIGKIASTIFWPKCNGPARNPFASMTEQTFDSVSIEIGDTRRDVVFSVSPRLDADGNFTGVCGTCRDVSTRVKKERQTKRDNLRMAVQQRVTQILNASENAQELLDSASQELVDVLRADHVWAVVRRQGKIVPAAVYGDHKEILDLDGIWHQLAGSDQAIQDVDVDGKGHLAVRLERGGVGIGMVIIGRDTKISPWSQQERRLLEQIADILTAAFRKAELIDRLSHLSGRDELTGLLNRRALKELVEKRLQHQRRTGAAGCIVFIDLDHFKEVNDTLGHKAGDEAIKMVADFLQHVIRPSDYAGRVGGDEFVLWIEDAAEDVAAEKARRLLEYMPDVRKALGNADLGLGASVGICRSVAGKNFDFAELTDRADAALYRVKKAGRNDIAYATEQPETAGEQKNAK